VTAWPSPSRALRVLVGEGDLASFRRVGEDCLGQLLAAGLPLQGRVLEIGCGCGRIAAPLSRVLGARATYLGLDVRSDLIAYGREEITPRDGRFRFERLDLKHPFYNPRGRGDAARLRLSGIGRFDFVILISVLTHLDWTETRHYLSEVRRLLAPGGLAFVTFYLHSPRLRSTRGPRFDALFPFRAGRARFNVGAHAFSHEERGVLEACAKAGLSLSRPIIYGDWTAASPGPWPPQDALVLSPA